MPIAIAALSCATPALARTTYVAPYIEIGQVVDANLRSDDVVTYSQVAVGVDAGIASPHAQGQISLRYDRRFAWNDRLADTDFITGLARGSVRLGSDLSFDAGALATRARSDMRGAAPGVLAGDVDNMAQLYSFYAGPSLSTRAGALQIAAGYRFGYTRADTPGFTGIAPGQPRLDYFSESTGHLATASIGVAAGEVAPFGVTLSGGFDRENAGQLAQRYQGQFVRGDVMMPVSRTVALRAGAGYEKIEASQKDPLVDANGNPVLDGRGRFVTDPSAPRRIAYRTDGLIYDAGVVWRPSPRLELQANAGYRYGGATYFGSLAWQTSGHSALNAQVYDSIQTFGRQLTGGLAALPTAFQTQNDPFGQQLTGCIFAAQPGTGTGGAAGGAAGGGAGSCLNNIFQSISTATYRARGVDAIYSWRVGRSTLGVGVGYADRKLYAPQGAPGITVLGANDQSYYSQIFYARALSRNSQLDARLFANYYESGLPGTVGVLGLGATGTYMHQFGRLGTTASLGIYGYDQHDIESQWSAQALLGARYTF